jgi:hypothetical protein
MGDCGRAAFTGNYILPKGFYIIAQGGKGA